MFEKIKRHSKKYGLAVLVVSLSFFAVFVFYLDWQYSHPRLTFVMLDVGQGDALFIESPTGTQILIDAGPPRKVLSPLSRAMSPFDRSLDVAIITNPDQDHIGGFLDVLSVYKVGKFLESGTLNDSKSYQNLREEIKNKNIPMILAERGMRLHLGGGAILDILFPDRNVSSWTANDGSIVARLDYGDTSIILAGDSTIKTEKIILENYSSSELESKILKVGHHGSRTSSSDAFVRAVSPVYALISNGRENKYGHPHSEILDALSSAGAEIFRTDLLGTIVMKSDGQDVKFSFHK